VARRGDIIMVFAC